MRYKTTSKGTQLPDRWGLPDALRDDTGVIFASCFPGFDSFADEMSRYYADHARREQMAMLESLRARVAEANGDSVLATGNRPAHRRVARRHRKGAVRLRPAVPVPTSCRWGIRNSPNSSAPAARTRRSTAACASTTQAVAVAEDWIHAGRCRRVIIISADDITSDHLIEWFGAGFLASGAAATDEVVEEAATAVRPPAARHDHGDGRRGAGGGERGSRARTRHPADLRGVGRGDGEQRLPRHAPGCAAHRPGDGEPGVARRRRAAVFRASRSRRSMVFVSHETYTPARGGSASAEIHALRRVFGEAADRIVIANTKGFTGHAMGTGIEDVVAVKALETGCVPPVANFKEVDPELGPLNLSKGGAYPVEYALRLGAGFGSQISMTLMRWVAPKDGARPQPERAGLRLSHRRSTTPGMPGSAGWRTSSRGSGSGPPHVARARSRAAPSAKPPSDQCRASRPVAPRQHCPIASRCRNAGDAALNTGCRHRPQRRPSDPVKERVLALVAEKTGYPMDMLDLDLDLEADLGVDTVKQAEVFATIREAYGIPRDDNIKLRDFPLWLM